jgi:Family of unknown function (DUF5681)
MADYEIGYGKPPRSKRFKAGVSGNPKGRPKRRLSPLVEILKNVFDGPIEYRDNGRRKVATPLELALKMIVDRAVAGDLPAAELALRVRERAEHHGNIGIGQILVEGWLPDYPRQTAEQKSRDLSLRHDVDPTEWWRQPEEGLKG